MALPRGSDSYTKPEGSGLHVLRSPAGQSKLIQSEPQAKNWGLELSDHLWQLELTAPGFYGCRGLRLARRRRRWEHPRCPRVPRSQSHCGLGLRASSSLGQQPAASLTCSPFPPLLFFLLCQVLPSLILPALLSSPLLPLHQALLLVFLLLLIGVPHLPGSLCPPGHFSGSPQVPAALAQQSLVLGMVAAILGVPLGFSHLSTLSWGRGHIFFLLCGEDLLASHVTVCHTSKGATDASCGRDVQRTVRDLFKGQRV